MWQIWINLYCKCHFNGFCIEHNKRLEPKMHCIILNAFMSNQRQAVLLAKMTCLLSILNLFALYPYEISLRKWFSDKFVSNKNAFEVRMLSNSNLITSLLNNFTKWQIYDYSTTFVQHYDYAINSSSFWSKEKQQLVQPLTGDYLAQTTAWLLNATHENISYTTTWTQNAVKVTKM